MVENDYLGICQASLGIPYHYSNSFLVVEMAYFAMIEEEFDSHQSVFLALI